MQFVCQDGRLHKLLNETLCNFTIDKRPQVWYNWRPDNGCAGPIFLSIGNFNKNLSKTLCILTIVFYPEIAYT